MKSDEVEQISNGNTKQTKTLKQINNTTTTKINLPYNKSLWNQKRYQGGTWTKPKFEQILSRKIVDKLPNFHSFPSTIQTSLSSSISTLTKERKSKKKTNKVDQF